jgi:pimeloyl-ACP methyl ester carboxylesterase
MPRPVAILHGWSDNSDSFKPLAAFLKKNGFKTIPLFLGDYISLRNDVKIDDVAKRMEEVVQEKMARPAGARDRLGKTFDLIVHSTGGLVARRWISMHYSDRTCPVQNLVMLAPANFGSKLAHKGRSMLGRVYKGWKTGFETGDEMLFALELSSPFLWSLAESDLFESRGVTSDATAVYYGADRVRPFVIVGTHPYTSLTAKLTNEHGSDGTVRVAAANLNTYGMTIDFSGDPKNLIKPLNTPWKRRGGEENTFPLAVLPDRTHGSIVRPDEPGLSKVPAVQQQLGTLILSALRTNTALQYQNAIKKWRDVTDETRTLAGASADAQKNRNSMFKSRNTPRENFHEYYQVFVRVEDEFGNEVPDYFLSFMARRKNHSFSPRANLPKEGVFFHDEVIEDTHVHQATKANRCLYIDRFDIMGKDGFYNRIKVDQSKELYFTVTAADPGDRIAYFSKSAGKKRGLVRLHNEADAGVRWLKRHSTHFIRIIVPRAADPDIFTLRRG